MADLAVLIVSYRTPSITEAAVRSALDIPGVREIIVVDNDSRDETVERLGHVDDRRLCVLVNDRNAGFGSASNRAARCAVSDVLVLLNSDAKLNAQASSALALAVLAEGGRAIIGARVVDLNGSVQRSAGLLPGPIDLAIRALAFNRLALAASRMPVLGSRLRRTRLATDYDSALHAKRPMDTSMVTGACFAIGREAFLELGGFDERFFMYFEDADLCRRAAQAGMPIRYVPSAVVTHIGGASSEGDYHFSPMHARSMLQYLEKWWGPPGTALALLLLGLRLIGHALVLHRGTPKALAALRAALRP